MAPDPGSEARSPAPEIFRRACAGKPYDAKSSVAMFGPEDFLGGFGMWRNILVHVPAEIHHGPCDEIRKQEDADNPRNCDHHQEDLPSSILENGLPRAAGADRARSSDNGLTVSMLFALFHRERGVAVVILFLINPDPVANFYI